MADLLVEIVVKSDEALKSLDAIKKATGEAERGFVSMAGKQKVSADGAAAQLRQKAKEIDAAYKSLNSVEAAQRQKERDIDLAYAARGSIRAKQIEEGSRSILSAEKAATKQRTAGWQEEYATFVQYQQREQQARDAAFKQRLAQLEQQSRAEEAAMKNNKNRLNTAFSTVEGRQANYNSAFGAAEAEALKKKQREIEQMWAAYGASEKAAIASVSRQTAAEIKNFTEARALGIAQMSKQLRLNDANRRNGMGFDFSAPTQSVSGFRGKMLELAQAIRFVDGPLGGVASRVSTLGNIFDTHTKSIALFTLGLAGAVAGIRQYIRAADEMNRLKAQLKLVTEGTQEYEGALKSVFETAKQNGQAVATLGNTYVSIRSSLGDVSGAAAKTDAIMRALSAGFRINKTGAAEQAAGILQLSQALSKGKLDGDEFKSVSENQRATMIELRKALMQVIPGFDGSKGAMLEMSKAGKLTSDVITKGLIIAMGELEKKAKLIPLSLGEAFQNLKTGFLELATSFEKTTGLTQGLADAIAALARSIPDLARAVQAAAIAFALWKIPLLLVGLRGLSAEVLGAINIFKMFPLVLVGNQAALVGLAGYMRAGAAGAGLLATALRGLAVVMKAIPIMAVVYAIQKLITPLEAQKRITDEVTKSNIEYSTGIARIQAGDTEYAETLRTNTLSRIKSLKSEIEVQQMYLAQRGLGAQALGIKPSLGSRIGLGAEKVVFGVANDIGGLFGAEPIETRAQHLADFNTQYGAYIENLGRLDEIEKALGGAKAAKGGFGSASSVKNAKDLNKEFADLVAAQQISTEEAIKKADAVGMEAGLSKQMIIDAEVAAELEKVRLDYAQKGLTLTDERLKILGGLKRIELEAVDREKQRTQELERAKKAAEELGDALEKSLSDAIYGGLTGGLSGFFQNLRDQLVRGLADQIAAGVRGAVQSDLNSASGLSANGQGFGSTGGGLGNLSSLSGITKVFGGALDAPLFTPGSSLASGINTVGTSFGYGSPLSGGLQGPTQGLASQFTVGSSLAGLGGSLLSSALFGGGMGNTIGSGIGGIAGTLVGGPVGAAIGSFLGGGLGSMFGGGTPHPASNFELADGKRSYGSKHMDDTFARGLLDAVLNSVATLTQATGRSFNTTYLTGGSDNGVGSLAIGDFKTSTQEVNFDPSSEKATTEAVGKFSILLAKQIDGLTADLTTALDKIATEGKTAEEVLTDIAFVLNFDTLGKIGETISEVETAWTTLNKTLDDATAKTKELGLSELKMSQFREKALSAFRTAFVGDIQSGITGALDPAVQSLAAENIRYGGQKKDAQLLGVGLEQVELLHQINLLKIYQEKNTAIAQEQQKTLQEQLQATEALKNTWGGLVDSIQKAIDDLRLGNLSPLSPYDKLQEAKVRFQSLQSAAAGGDSEAASQLADSGRTLLDLSKAYNASTTAYAADFAMVEAGLRSTKTVAEQQLNILSASLTTQQGMLAALQNAAATGGATAAYNANEKLISLRGTLSATDFARAESVVASATPGVLAGEGRRTAYLNSNATANAAAVNALRALGIPGFASGGTVTGGIPGMDSVAALLMPGERVLNRSEARTHANDNATTKSDMIALRREIAMLTREVVRLNALTEEANGTRQQQVAVQRRATRGE